MIKSPFAPYPILARHILSRLAITSVACVAAVAPVNANDAAYLLNPHDEIILRALRWNPETSNFQPWDGISGDYALDPQGRLSLPLVGILDVEGMSIEAASDLISDQLQLETGSADRVEIGLEVSGHQPVYVLGDVRAPGAVAFLPGLTAQQALALVGGLRRLLNEDQPLGAKDLFQMQGSTHLLEQQLENALAKRQGALDELAALSDVSGQDMTGDVMAAQADGAAKIQLSEVDKLIIANLRESKSDDLDSLKILEDFLSEQISGLASQRKLLGDQIARVEVDLANAEKLREQGLAANSRTTALANSLSTLQSDGIQLDIALLNAQQQLSRVQRESKDIFASARNDLLRRLQQAEDEVATLNVRLSSARVVLGEIARTGATSVADEGTLVEPQTVFTRTRVVDGVPVEDTMRPTDRLEPGDTLVISLERPEN